MMRRRYEWVRGTIERDGYLWNMRIPDGFQGLYTKEDVFKNEILQAGETFVDVGANTGGWCIRASKHYRTVIAFEPTPVTYGGLVKNLATNSIHNVRLHQVALSNFDGESRMFHFVGIGRGGGGNSLINRHPSFPRNWIETFPVTVRTLDSYGFKPDLIKIDAEGSELDVLHGAAKTLDSTRRVIVEVHDEDAFPEVRSFLDRLSFATRVAKIPKHPAFCHIIGERVGDSPAN